MKKTLLYCIFYFMFLSTYSQKNGQVLSSTLVSYPAYEEIKGVSDYYDKVTYTSVMSSFN
jgi:hypothetical protein